MKRAKRNEKGRIYSDLMNYKCANPNCISGLNAEAHHIIPLKQRGPDAYWNLICLCRVCHLGGRNHSLYNERCTALFTWKSMQELETLGFYLDEQAEDYYECIKKALLGRNDARKQLSAMRKNRTESESRLS